MGDKTKWSCSECGYLIETDKPPETCPSCKKNCMFIDATCYTPECGGTQNVNQDVIARRRAGKTTK
jgi:rubredoxin